MSETLIERLRKRDCPKCGGTNIVPDQLTARPERDRWTVECLDCSWMTATYETQEAAWAAWNADLEARLAVSQENVERVDETAWLVEFPESGDHYRGGKRIGPATPRQYYCAIPHGDRVFARTEDPFEAMRFARKQDAEAMIARLNSDSEFGGYGKTGGFACEHMWIGEEPARAAIAALSEDR